MSILRRAGAQAAGLLLLVPLLAGCGRPPLPTVTPRVDPGDRPPVVLVPGTTGTELRDARTGAVTWGNVRSLLFPRDKGYRLALPIDGSPSPTPQEAGAALRALSIPGIYHKPIYEPWIELMEAHGYRFGDTDAPRPEDGFFIFRYDWRESNVEAAAELVEFLERLRSVRGEETLTVHLVVQSNGALIARWAARYGAAGLEQAEAGRAAPPERLRFERILFVGTANGGAMRVLRELHKGRRYLVALGRWWAPEVLGTIPALYEGLPVYRRRPFFDVEGRLLDADLFDVDTWVEHGLGIFAERAARRADRRPDLFGTREQRRAHVARQLDRTLRIQRLLRVDPPGFRPGRYLLIRNGLTPTPDRALLLPRDGRREPRVLFHDARRVRRDPLLRARAVAPGDEHATLDSQEFFSPAERAAVQVDPFYADGGHFEMILNPATQRRCLRFLLDPSAEEPAVNGILPVEDH